METTIPNAIHLCAGCGVLVSGEAYCPNCTPYADYYEEQFHAQRLSRQMARLPRETGRMPEDKPASPLARAVVFALGLGACLAFWAFVAIKLANRWL